jgi:hypothetical protein
MARKYAEGAAVVGDSQTFRTPELSLRQYYALHAPPPPSWWRVGNAIDQARWSWTWADAMVKAESNPTTPESAESRPRT